MKFEGKNIVIIQYLCARSGLSYLRTYDLDRSYDTQHKHRERVSQEKCI
jgi:hypothetical protein